MPNWCFGCVNISGDIKNVKKFLKLFIWSDEEGNKTDKEYFARSFIHEKYKDFVKENLKGIKGHIDISLSVDFAWSCHSCLIEGYPDDIKECVTLDYACKKYNVNVKIETEESGLGFEENISCDNKGTLIEDCKEMPIYTCECGNEQQISSNYCINDVECYECEECGKWKT